MALARHGKLGQGPGDLGVLPQFGVPVENFARLVVEFLNSLQEPLAQVGKLGLRLDMS